MLHTVLLTLCFLGCNVLLLSQDFKFEVSLNSQKIDARVDKRILQSLEKYINTFINAKKWSQEPANPEHAIIGSLLLTLEGINGTNFEGTLIIQAERQIYNTTYYSTLFNHKDNDVQFRFDLNQIDNFNENTLISGNTPLRANLPAILSFYVYLILGLDYDSQRLYYGNKYFSRSLNIANNASASSGLKGWKPYANTNNRFELIKELTTSKYRKIHSAIYEYYRKGMDQLYDSSTKALVGIKKALHDLAELQKESPNSLQLYLFMQSHKTEIDNILSMIENQNEKKEMMRLARKLHP